MVTGNSLHLHSNTLSSPLHSIDEEDDAVLDEYILDDSNPAEMATHPFSSPHNVFASPQFLPHEEDSWPAYTVNYAAPSFNPVNALENPQAHSSQASLMQDTSSSYPMYSEHPASWQPINIGMRTQGAAASGLTSSYDVKIEDNSTNQSMPPPNGLPLSGSHEHTQYGPQIASPQSETGWLSASSTSDRSHKNAQREAAGRTFATFPSHLRREGIRKKNARVEIPDGRTIDTIEEEIKMCDPNDEAKLKELKQYKRLLRNREAALSSRSRKKEHAQRLEEENKLLAANEESLKMRESYWIRECQRLTQTLEKYAAKEEDMVRRHTLETGELRKKISFLTEEIQSRSEVPMSSAPTSATYSHTFSEFDPITMSSSPQWEDFSFANSSGMGADMQKTHESAMTVRQKEAKTSLKENEPAVSSLLLMLLLCGAWVASSSSGARPVTVPEMSEDVRAASAAVLHNIYKDAGIQPHEGPIPSLTKPLACAPGSSQLPSHTFSQSFDGNSVHQQLTDPSRQQQQDQAFSLTPDQYNHISSDWFNERPKPASPQRRRNLADALANLHVTKRTTATDAYTKSLLVDEVPANVVRDFHRMVAERKNGQVHDQANN